MFPGSTSASATASASRSAVTRPATSTARRQTSLNGWFGTTTVAGWAIDPDTTSSIDVHVYVDGVGTRAARRTSRATTSPSCLPATTRHPTASPGTIPVVYGKREICAYGINIAGARRAHALLNCVDRDDRPGPDRIVRLRQPRATGINVRGWALDADSTGAIDVHAYVNGTFAGAATANTSRPDVDARVPAQRLGPRLRDDGARPTGHLRTSASTPSTPAPGRTRLLGCKTLTSNRRAHRVPRLGAARARRRDASAGGRSTPTPTDAIEVHTYIDGVGAGAHDRRASAARTSWVRSRCTGRTTATPRPTRPRPGVHNVCTYGDQRGRRRRTCCWGARPSRLYDRRPHRVSRARALELVVRARRSSRSASASWSAKAASRRRRRGCRVLGRVVVDDEQLVAVELGVGPERQEVAGLERLADHRDRRARHAVERRAIVGRRQADLVLAVHRHRRPAVRPHRQRRVARRRARGRTSRPSVSRCTSRPHTPDSACSRTDVAVPVEQRDAATCRACVCAGVDAEQVDAASRGCRRWS